VGEFTLLVDFTVLETEGMMSSKNEILVIISQLFLVASNALINYKDGKLKLTFGNMTMKLNVFNIQKQLMDFDDVEHQSLNWVGDFAFGKVEVDYEEELMLCVFESFCMEYEPEYDALAFEDQYDDSLQAYIVALLSSIPPLSYEAALSVPSSSSLELKPLPNMLKYAFFAYLRLFQ